MTLRIGTSGWQYRDWRGTVYPEGEPTRRWLPCYAEMFDTVELNNSFYRLPDPSRFATWAAAVPDGFCFAVKASRYLTHVRRLRDPADPVARLMDHARALGPKLGPVLVQLPPNLRADCEALEAVLDAFPDDARVAVEFRHPSWESAEVDAVLGAHDASCVLADRKGRVSGRRTAGWAYVRLHEGRAAPVPCYGHRALASWIDRIVDLWGHDVDGYLYCNNDPHGCAAHNAADLQRLARRAGIDQGDGEG